jgi:hypothetical protein
VGRYLRLAKPSISTTGLEGAGEAKPVIPTADILRECAPIANGIDLSLLETRLPHQQDNVVLYGQYILDRKLVRRRRSQKVSSLAYKITRISLVPLKMRVVDHALR